MGLKGSGGGEIVQVQGGHVIRSTCRKDRHSKIFTAKGPRDRRVRLSAHTAIQFYDVQDRLGYDRPSKAVDWLIKMAQTAIDKLAEVPQWNPAARVPDANTGLDEEESNKMSMDDVTRGYNNFQFQNQRLVDSPQPRSNYNTSGNFLAPSVHPDTMKSSFLTSYPVEDLGLSLHLFQDQSLIHGRSHQANTNHAVSTNEQTLFSVPSGPAGFQPNATAVSLLGWSNNAGGAESGLPTGIAFNPAQFYHHQQQQQQHQHHQQQETMMLGQHSPAFSQRGTLQSSFLQSLRNWNDLGMVSADHSRTTQDIHHHQSLVFGSRFAPESLPSGFTTIPTTIHREDERSQSVVSDRQTSSPSPVSRQ